MEIKNVRFSNKDYMEVAEAIAKKTAQDALQHVEEMLEFIPERIASLASKEDKLLAKAETKLLEDIQRNYEEIMKKKDIPSLKEKIAEKTESSGVGYGIDGGGIFQTSQPRAFSNVKEMAQSYGGVAPVPMESLEPDYDDLPPAPEPEPYRYGDVVKAKSKPIPKKAFVAPSRVYEPCIVEDNMQSTYTPSEMEDFQSLRESFNVYKSENYTSVFAIAVDRKGKENEPAAIRCHGNTAFGGYVHDLASDSYLVDCAGFYPLGQLTFSLYVRMKNVGNWKMNVPIPEAVLEKSFTPAQRKTLDGFREKFSNERYEIHFIQMLACR